jgi:UDP-glucose:(heptosyl)LPS alpha-1,3-glucosyltransferase
MNRPLAFILYKFFPFGGLARDFKRIAMVCKRMGYEIDVFVMEWQGDMLDGFNISIFKGQGWSNRAKVERFHRQVQAALKIKAYSAVVGFNKMPGLDVYYAADPCYVERFVAGSFVHRLNPRYRYYAGIEAVVFSEHSETVCLMISDVQQALFKHHYNTPAERLLMLPPGIDLDRRRPKEACAIRKQFRQELGFSEDDVVILMVGTGFKTKGVDRGIIALSSMPESIASHVHLVVVGEDDLVHYQQMAAHHQVANQVQFMGGRDDIPKFLLSADLLLHSARKDNTGTVILEAIVAGLPVLVTDVCGYAKHVAASSAGLTIPSPFKQLVLNAKLVEMLDAEKRSEWSANALAYAEKEDLYSMPDKAAQVVDQIARGKVNGI